MLLDVLKGFVPALLGMLFVPPHHLSRDHGRRRSDARPLATAVPALRQGREDGRHLRRRLLRRRALVALAAGVVWLVVFLALRYASLASIAGGIALPVFALLLGYPTSVVLFGAAAAAAILFLHRANLARLRAGTESRFHFRRPARLL